MKLWGQVITLRGQILVSRTDDATLRVLCCVLCVCSLCVVCVGWCWCSRFVTLTSPPPSPHTHPSPRVYVRNAVHIQNVPVCTGTTPASVTTCGRVAGTHGDVLNVHTGVFSVPHHTTRTHHDHNDTHTTQQQPPQQHRDRQAQTGTERDRERQREKERKTRQDKTRREGKRR